MNSSATQPKSSSRWIRVTARILALVFLLWVGFVTFIWRAMHRPPEAFARVMSHMPWPVFLVLPFETLWTRARAGSLEVGDQAPDFSLLKTDKSGTVRLSELNRKQPVVMIFGSYT
jgi:hypothetical protein